MNAMRSLTGGKKVGVKVSKLKAEELAPAKEQELKPVLKSPTVGFGAAAYSVLESDLKMTFHIIRSSGEGTVSVEYFSEDVTANAGTDYEAVQGVCTFAPGETKKEFEVKIIDDDEVELDESFLLKLKEDSLTCEGVASECVLDALTKTTTVTIIDDDLPGQVQLCVWKGGGGLTE